MAGTTPRSTKQVRGRAVRQHGRNWTIPVVMSLLGIVVLGLLLWQWQRGSASTSAVAPISTLSTPDYHALVWSPTEADVVFFGHHNGVLKSTDGGRNWQPTSLANADAMSLTASPKAPERMYAAGHGVFLRSDDGGETWTVPDTTLQGADVHGFTQSPVDPDVLYAFVVGTGISKSTDGGVTWTQTGDAIAGEAHTALAVWADGKALLRGTTNGVEQSTDDGSTWARFGSGLPRNTLVLALAVQPDGDVVFAATTDGLYRWSHDNDTWTATALTGTILAVAASPVQPNIVLTVDDEGRVYRSDDSGRTWNGAK
jgi:hypothetical protein